MTIMHRAVLACLCNGHTTGIYDTSLLRWVSTCCRQSADDPSLDSQRSILGAVNHNSRKQITAISVVRSLLDPWPPSDVCRPLKGRDFSSSENR